MLFGKAGYFGPTAALTPLPLEPILNGRLVWTPARRKRTGGWDQAHQRWAVIGGLPFHNPHVMV